MKTLASAALALLLGLSPAFAQDSGQGPGGQGPGGQGPGRRNAPQGQAPQGPSAPEGRRLPPDQTTRHTLELPDGRTLRFTATAGSLPLVDDGGRLQAEIAYTAYALDGASPSTRPVTFALNGGPGASSAYLHLTAIGPWRLPVDERTISPSAPTALVPNAETWLDFTDLVFIDPVGTGYSRAAGSGDDANRYYAVDTDASVLSAAIARYLRNADRLSSPKFFVGESYGGFRGPLIAGRLQTEVGVGLSGLVLLSPVLDFAWLSQPRYTPWAHVTRLPSLAAAALERRGRPATRAALAEAEAYAVGDYMLDLVRGVRDPAVVARLSERVAGFTGLDAGVVRRAGGRIGAGLYQREAERDEGRVASAYDPRVTSFDPDPTAPGGVEDPILTALKAPLTTAAIEHGAKTLNWRVADARYELLNNAVNRAWRWGGGRGSAEAVGALREALALDPALRVLVVHGLSDLVTPYFASKMILDQIPDYGGAGRLALATYPGGHMFYARDASRRAFRADVAALYEAALAARRQP